MAPGSQAGEDRGDLEVHFLRGAPPCHEAAWPLFTELQLSAVFLRLNHGSPVMLYRVMQTKTAPFYTGSFFKYLKTGFVTSLNPAKAP